MAFKTTTKKNLKKIYLVSLGCARNLVDSELMIGRLIRSGWSVSKDPRRAHAIIVNTCSFIESAIDESIDTILELSAYKHQGVCKRLVITGCLPERFREAIIDALPEVDVFLGTGAYDQVVSALENSLNQPECILLDPNQHPLQKAGDPRVRSAFYQAYLKISEGCNKRCTYCIIPKLRGKQRSRFPEDLVTEARSLVDSGVKEITLIAQDSTSYGRDLTPPLNLPVLLSALSTVLKDAWIRILYGHPASLDDHTIKAVSTLTKVCSYYDVPIQHASDDVLKRMHREYTQKDLYQMVDKIRNIDPDGVLRTTVIVGFPGETDSDFETLMKFVENVRFDHLGAFLYSDSNDLTSHLLPGHVSTPVAQYRFDRLMSLQSGISLKNNQRHIHKVYSVLVEKKVMPNIFSGRTFFQAPEVDGLTLIRAAHLETGRFIHARITEAREYDLIGEPV